MLTSTTISLTTESGSMGLGGRISFGTSTTSVTATGSNSEQHDGLDLSSTASPDSVSPASRVAEPSAESMADSLTQDLLAELSGNRTFSTKVLPGGTTATVMRLDVNNGPVAGKLEVVDPGSKIEVTIPTSAFAGIVPEGEEVFLSVVAHGNETVEEQPVQDKQPGLKQLAAVSISLRLAAGRKLKVEGLEEAVQFSMPANFSSGVYCAFWDEAGKYWSTEGVEVSTQSVPGGPLVCNTRHFTLFGALLQGFVETVACAQFWLFSSEGIRELLNSQWYLDAGVWLYGCSLGVLLAIVASAAVMDHWRGYHMYWSPVMFLIPGRPDDPTDAEDDEASPPRTPAEHAGALRKQVGGSCLYMLGCVCGYCLESSTRDALDEICSEWFEYFSEVRSLVEGIISEIQCTRTGTVHARHSAMAQLVIMCAARMTAASLGVSHDLVVFVLQDKDLERVLMDRFHKRQLAGLCTQPPRADWWKCADREDAWAKLHADVTNSIHGNVRHSWRDVPCMIWQVYKVHSPLGSIISLDIFIKSQFRALFFLMDFSGTLMVICIFFATSGSLKGKPIVNSSGSSCGDADKQDDFTYKVGRAFAVTVASALLAGLPVTLIQSFHTVGFKKINREGSPQWKRQLRTWHAQERIIWIIGSLYVLFTNFFVVLFCANVGQEDLENWKVTLEMSLAWEFVLVPLGNAVLVPTLAGSFLAVNSWLASVHHGHMLRHVQNRLLTNTNVMLPLMSV